MAVTRTEYCICGASIKLTGAKWTVARAIATWKAEHVGDGHGPATRKMAYMARIRSDRRAVQEAHRATTSEASS